MKMYKYWELLKMSTEYKEYYLPLEKRPKFRNKDDREIYTFMHTPNGPGIGKVDAKEISCFGHANEEFEKIEEGESVNDLKNIEMTELLKELERREGVVKINVGLYQEYELKEKYTCCRGTAGKKGKVYSGTVLIVEDHLDAR